ncbi:MAG: radical SAM protein [Cyanobacteria bacterium K_DeepCast_35m_m2_023]|nr:radical SAM protein [Cyanobacteria bacterium K_DeepCast_35m_m2_023]
MEYGPADWDEESYLALYADVKAAVAAGHLPSGWHHYQQHGWAEGRRSGNRPAPSGHQTRLCYDPWTYLEITPGRVLKACCNFGTTVELDQLNVGSLHRAWNSEPFQQLRQQLRDGRLNERCTACHIRPWIPADDFAALLADQGFDLNPGPLRTLRVEVTTACNLRCTYCPVSQPWYEPRSMTLDTFDQVLALLADQDPQTLQVHLNGHGETTIHPQWLSFAQRVLDLGFRPQLITNLSRPLAVDEAAALARFAVICVSLDTVDPLLLRQMRRSVELKTIEANLKLIRTLGDGDPPALQLSCGVYDQTVMGLEQLGTFCQKHGIAAITFWQLVKYPDVPDALNARPIPSLPEPQRRHSIEAFERAVNAMEAKGILVDVAGGFLEDWKRDLIGAEAHPSLAP